MFNPAYCKHMIKTSTLLAFLHLLGALIFAGICCVMLYASKKQFQWEFAWIHMISLTLACLARTAAIKEWRTRRLFQKYRADATREQPAPRPACTATVIGQH